MRHGVLDVHRSIECEPAPKALAQQRQAHVLLLVHVDHVQPDLDQVVQDVDNVPAAVQKRQQAGIVRRPVDACVPWLPDRAPRIRGDHQAALQAPVVAKDVPIRAGLGVPLDGIQVHLDQDVDQLAQLLRCIIDVHPRVL